MEIYMWLVSSGSVDGWICPGVFGFLWRLELCEEMVVYYMVFADDGILAVGCIISGEGCQSMLGQVVSLIGDWRTDMMEMLEWSVGFSGVMADKTNGKNNCG